MIVLKRAVARHRSDFSCKDNAVYVINRILRQLFSNFFEKGGGAVLQIRSVLKYQAVDKEHGLHGFTQINTDFGN